MRVLRHTIAAVAIASALPLSANAAGSLAEASRAFDAMDREEMFDALDKASGCIGERDFDCSTRQLQIARGLANTDDDRRAWQAVADSHDAEVRMMREEREEEERLERQQAQWERDEQEREERAQERYQRKLAESYARATVFVGMQTHLSPDQKQQLIEAWVADEMGDTGGANIRAAGERINGDLAEQLQAKQERLREMHAEQRRQREADMRAALERRRADNAEAARVARADAQNRQRATLAAAAAETVAQTDAQQARQRADAEAKKLADARAKQEAEVKARQDAEARAKLAAEEKARKDAEREKAKAEQLAAKKAAQEEKARAEAEYLRQVTAQVRMGAKNCFGEYHVGSTRPQIKPELVGCIDIRFRATCPDGRNFTEGVFDNVVGMGTGCYGDTERIEKLPCDAKDIRVQALETRACGGFK